MNRNKPWEKKTTTSSIPRLRLGRSTSTFNTKVSPILDDDMDEDMDLQYIDSQGEHWLEDQLDDGLHIFDATMDDIDDNGNIKEDVKAKYKKKNRKKKQGRNITEREESSDEEEDEEIDGFVSSSAEYRITLLNTRVDLYASHIKKQKEKIKGLKDSKKSIGLALKQSNDDLERERRENEEQRGAQSYSAFNLRNANRDTAKDWKKQRQEAMMKLMTGAADMEEEDTDVFSSGNGPATFKTFKVFLKRIYPLSADLKQIEARFGTSVYSYFRFFRWIIVNYIFFTIASTIFFIRHVINVWTRTAENEQAQIRLDRHRTFPYIMMFQSYGPEEALEYTLLLVVTAVVMIIITLHKWVHEDKVLKTMEFIENSGGKKKRYSLISLNAWDFYMKSEAQATDMKKSIAEQIRVNIHEDNIREEKANRDTWQHFKIVVRRFLGSVGYFYCQVGSWSLIITVTTRSEDIQALLTEFIPILEPYAVFTVPLAVSAINGLLPSIIMAMTDMEMWDDNGFTIKAMITRLFIAKIMNVGIQLFSYALVLDPHLFTETTVLFGYEMLTMRRRTEKIFEPQVYECRAEQVSFGLFTLVLTEFVVSKVVAVFLPYLYKFWYKITSADYVKEEFYVAQQMVTLLNFQTLLLMIIPFSPVAVIFGFVFLVINFKYEKWILMNFQRKPMNSWSAKDSGNFFIKFYFVTICIFSICVHLLLYNPRLPKECTLQKTTVLDGVDLCLPNTYNNATMICELSESSRANYFAGLDLNVTDRHPCVEGYPKCICEGELACGPFIFQSEGYSIMTSNLKNTIILGPIFKALTESIIVWLLLMTLAAMLYFFLHNSAAVIRFSSAEQQQGLFGEVDGLRKKIAGLETKLKVQQQYRE